ncbi:hypothetical protein SAMN06264849_103140 [Melghirimyces algeriensis]|uniref:Uncharacterized protein n=2 Tax=Melghirimyces algeriensis TaxID=910412 RepID=A0A521C5E6_9BACL|nr:hypothetical protein SAMN06264849_103140 [Melghirimyces algeriensis]
MRIVRRGSAGLSGSGPAQTDGKTILFLPPVREPMGGGGMIWWNLLGAALDVALFSLMATAAVALGSGIGLAYCYLAEKKQKNEEAMK